MYEHKNLCLFQKYDDDDESEEPEDDDKNLKMMVKFLQTSPIDPTTKKPPSANKSFQSSTR